MKFNCKMGYFHLSLKSIFYEVGDICFIGFTYIIDFLYGIRARALSYSEQCDFWARFEGEKLVGCFSLDNDREYGCMH
jgi:hypothetical protein